MTQKNLYRFFVDCGRSGDLEGLFVATPGELEEAYGHKLYFGEVLGKHSDVTVDFQPEDVELVTDDQDFVKKLVEFVGDPVSGFDPLAQYYQQKEDGDYE